MRVKKIVVTTSAILIFLVIIVFISSYILINASLPEREGVISINGIKSEIEIYFDNMGIPQVWAENEEDAWLTVGWLHANDRLFQMELTKRAAAGRLSELLGDITLAYDRRQRIIGHSRIADQNIQNLPKSSKRLLMAYISGINHWAESTSALPFEYYLLGISFEPWTIKDCLTIYSFQTMYSNDLQNNDFLYTSLQKVVGRDKLKELIIPYPHQAPKTVPQSAVQYKREIKNIGIARNETGWRQFFSESLFSGGKNPFLLTESSNAWVVSGSKSNSGNAILSSDPHLLLIRLPQFWYIVGIHTNNDSLNVLGITTPGIPSIAMGHNGKIAWAFTAGGIDVSDEYIERLNPADLNEYQVKENFVPFQKTVEYIEVKGWDEPDTLLIRSTRHGPVVEENISKNEVYALHWAGFDLPQSQAVKSGFNMVKVKSFNEFRKLVTGFAALDANWMYADDKGNIGYQLGTPLPIRNTDISYVRLPGWNDEFDWSGYQPLENTPHAYNPKRGWLANCNNKPDEKNLDYNLKGNFADDRIRRITELISPQNNFTIEDMKKYQQDLRSHTLILWKDEAIRVLKELGEIDWVQKLEQWQGTADIESKETAIIETWFALMKRYTFSDEFDDLIDDLMNRVVYRDRNFEAIYFGDNEVWFDDVNTSDNIEKRNDIAIRAMRETLNMIDKKNWGEVQTITMAHPMAGVPLLSTLLSLQRGPFPRGGTTGSLNHSSALWEEKGTFKTIGGPSWRFIIDFNHIDQAQMVLPAGQSGHPLSNHFFDFYELWEKGEYWTVPFSKRVVEERSVSRLYLIPSNSLE